MEFGGKSVRAYRPIAPDRFFVMPAHTKVLQEHRQLICGVCQEANPCQVRDKRDGKAGRWPDLTPPPERDISPKVRLIDGRHKLPTNTRRQLTANAENCVLADRRA
jgi:hypothetical protein